MKTIAAIGLAALGLSLTAAPVACAQDATRTVVMGYESFPPYSFTDETGAASGLSIDLMRALAEPLGYALRFVEADNPAQLLEMLQRGEIDTTSLLADIPARRQVGTFTLPLGEFSSSLFVLEGSDFAGRNDLSGNRIGVVAGSFAVTAARQVPFADIIELEDQDAVTLALLSGSVDAIASSTETFQKLLRTLDVEDHVRVISPPLLSSPRGFLVGPASPGLVESLDRSITQNISASDMDLLYDHWFGVPKSFAGTRAFWGMTGGLVVLATALFYAAFLHRRMRRSHARLHEKNLIVEALNCSDLAVGILDENLRFQFWNDNLLRLFPQTAPLVRRGLALSEISDEAIRLGARFEFVKPHGGGPSGAYDPQAIRNGDDRRRRIHLPNGRIIEAYERPFGDSMFITVRRDITASWEHLQTIDQQRDQLESQNRKLREFGSLVAHDLRSPISSQVSVLEMIQAELDSAAAPVSPLLGECISKSAESLHTMVAMIDDLLNDAVATESGKVSSTFDASTRISRCIAQAGLTADFSVEILGRFPKLNLAETEFDTVLRNLIGNAGKHHDRPDGRITITGRLARDGATICIEDDGPGIPEALRGQVFERGTKSAHDDTGGAGLGLAFVKGLVEKWGGRITLGRSAMGGAAFEILLPGDICIDDQPRSDAKVIPLASTA